MGKDRIRRDKTNQYYDYACAVRGCLSTNKSVPKRQFFRLPNEKIWKIKRDMWASAIQEANGPQWKPKNWHRICALHFKSGAPTDLIGSEDYVPDCHVSLELVEKNLEKSDDEKIVNIKIQVPESFALLECPQCHFKKGCHSKHCTIGFDPASVVYAGRQGRPKKFINLQIRLKSTKM